MTDTPDSFANHPKSITEIKGDKSDNAKDWKPRDALISALRDIDNGVINPTALVIASNNQDETTSYYVSSPDIVTSLGILDYVKMRMYDRRHG